MSPRLRAAACALALLALTALAGCVTSGRAPAPQPSWASATPRQTVIDIADDLKDAIIAAYPDLTITPDDQVLDPRSSDCTGSSAPTGEAIVWRSGWNLQVEPRQDTVPLLGKVVDQLIAQGWELRDSPTAPEYFRDLDRDGYYLTIAGHFDADGTVPATISFTAHSPCVDNPEH